MTKETEEEVANGPVWDNALEGHVGNGPSAQLTVTFGVSSKKL